MVYHNVMVITRVCLHLQCGSVLTPLPLMPHPVPQVCTDRETGRSRGFGFVTFADPNSAAMAVNQFAGGEIDGRAVRVEMSVDKRAMGGAPPMAASHGGGGGGYGAPPQGGGYGGGGGFGGGAPDNPMGLPVPAGYGGGGPPPGGGYGGGPPPGGGYGGGGGGNFGGGGFGGGGGGGGGGGSGPCYDHQKGQCTRGVNCRFSHDGGGGGGGGGSGGFPSFGGGGGGGGGGGKAKNEGDWDCDTCGNDNFAWQGPY